MLERRAAESLLEHGLRREEEWRTGTPLSVATKHIHELIHLLLTEGWLVEIEGAALVRSHGFDLSIESSNRDWFELRGGLDFDGEVVALPALLRAADENRSTITLESGGIGLLPETGRPNSVA